MNNLPEKLREVSDSYYDTITTGSSNTWDAPILMYAAADEIERLRALCNDLYHDATCSESFCRLCGEGIREWEASRD